MQIDLLLIVAGSNVQHYRTGNTNHIHSVNHLTNGVVVRRGRRRNSVATAAKAHREVSVYSIVGMYGVACDKYYGVYVVTSSLKRYAHQLNGMRSSRCYHRCHGMRHVCSAVYGVLQLIIREGVEADITYINIHHYVAARIVHQAVGTSRPCNACVIFGHSDKIDVYHLLWTRTTKDTVFYLDVRSTVGSGSRTGESLHTTCQAVVVCLMQRGIALGRVYCLQT